MTSGLKHFREYKMDGTELISIVMPAYNAALFIESTIDSIIAQTYRNWELIIVDDGSSDGTKEIVSRYISADKRIRYVHQNNGKQGKARNTGVAHAKGDFIAFQDADDLWKPDMLERQFRLLNQTDADLVFSRIQYIDATSNPLFDYHGISKVTYCGTEGLLELIKGNSIPIITVVARKRSIISAGGFKSSEQLQFGEDYDLWLRMLLNGAKFVSSNEPLALYRKHEMQSSKLAGTKYIQLLTIINDLKASGIGAEKEKAIKLWLKRAFRYTNPLTPRTIRQLLVFIPSASARRFSVIASYCLPVPVVRRLVLVLADLK